MVAAGDYEMVQEGPRLLFRTPFYRAEKASVLHGGVYTPEFSSMLLASCLSFGVYVLAGMTGLQRIVRFVISVVLFVPLFLGIKHYIFPRRWLEAVFDRASQQAVIRRPSLFFLSGRERIPFSMISSVDVGSRRYEPRNLDGIRFVQRISLQHGSAVPGLEDVEEYVTLSLRLRDGSERILYAVRADREPELPVQPIRDFLGSAHSHRKSTETT